VGGAGVAVGSPRRLLEAGSQPMPDSSDWDSP